MKYGIKLFVCTVFAAVLLFASAQMVFAGTIVINSEEKTEAAELKDQDDAWVETEVNIIEEDTTGCAPCKPEPCKPVSCRKIPRCRPVIVKYIAEKGGSVTPKSETLIYVSDKFEGALAIPDEGYEFDYWSKDCYCGFKSKENPFVPSCEVCATYRAHFKKVETPPEPVPPEPVIATYSITYKGIEGANFEKENPTVYTEGDLPITLVNPTKNDYDFTGWSDGDTTTTEMIIAEGTTGDLEFTATWQKQEKPEPKPTPTPSPSHSTSIVMPQYGWIQVGVDQWMYYFDAKQYATGWAFIDNLWFHFRANGIMDYGWLMDVDGTWYYLSEVHDGTFGKLDFNWHRDTTDGRIYYLDPKSGAMHTGEDYIDGKRYFFYDHYTPAWQQGKDGRWYYYDKSVITPYGAMVEGG